MIAPATVQRITGAVGSYAPSPKTRRARAQRVGMKMMRSSMRGTFDAVPPPPRACRRPPTRRRPPLLLPVRLLVRAALPLRVLALPGGRRRRLGRVVDVGVVV